ncbi:MAG: NAD(+) diphosphatase [Chromatiales bacterium]|nr:MAG: NAD(+) diphosphatase [Chromatiales bacterium]
MTDVDIPFAGSNLDRATAVRVDPDALAAALASAQARFVPVWRQRCLVDKTGACLPTAAELGTASPGADDAILLGRRDDQWLFAAELEASHEPVLAPGQVFAELREVMGELPAADAALVAYARAMVNWRGHHRHCGVCGAPNQAQEAGFVMACTSSACGHRSFPRLDPAVIVLVHRGDECLLGRQPTWPDGRYSTIAGFIEPGESLEDAVRREVAEETNVRVGACRYFASQPWPFPAALMIGFHAEASTSEIRLNDGELADARWLTREQIGAREVTLPPRTSVAFRLIETWFDAGGTTLRELGIEGPPLKLRR